MTTFNTFDVPARSLAGDVPTCTFHFTGDVVTAELEGAKLRAEIEGPGDRVRMSLHAPDGEHLAEVIVLPRAHRALTDNVVDIGASLLWSYWRWAQAHRALEAAAAAPVVTVQHAFDAASAAARLGSAKDGAR